MPDLFGLIFTHVSYIFSSAGGGGSGGGGGGGGSGGSGGGGIGGGLFLLGYLPMHLAGALVRKFRNNEVESVLGQGIGWAIAGIYTVFLLFFSFHVSLLFIVSAIGAPIGMAAGLYNLFGKIKQSRVTRNELNNAEQNDSVWNEQTLTDHAKDVFFKYQKDWTDYNTESMKTYLSPYYYKHAALLVYALQLAGRRDNVNSPQIIQATITKVDDSTDNSKDDFIIGFTAKANDQLIDTRDDKTIFTNNNNFSEFWRFHRFDNNWLLDGIQPATANQWSNNPALEEFASSQGFFYSLDMGWLLLPARGQLFGEGKFGVSDLNNHIIGMYKDCLVQIYTYNANPNANNKTYLIAQTNVPKSYGEILVRHKSGFHPFGIRGLTKVSMEWPDFNKKYEVFASDIERVTSFELLEPVFMEKLEALPFEVNINVVDNVVYLYAGVNSGNSNAANYQIMLDILLKAFQQMRL